MAQNLRNLNPQQLQQLQIQAIQQQLQAPNEFGTNKMLINVNGQNSKLPTNKNGIIKYTLETPIKLEIGDKITLVESFVEERGLAEDTISFEEDVEEEIRFLYYIQGDCRNTLNVAGASPYSGAVACDQEFTSFPNVYPDHYGADVSISKDNNGSRSYFGGIVSQEPYVYPNRNYLGTSPATLASGVGTGVNNVVGANGQYYYMCEYFNPQPPSTDEEPDDKFQWSSYADGSPREYLRVASGQNPQASFFVRIMVLQK